MARAHRLRILRIDRGSECREHPGQEIAETGAHAGLPARIAPSASLTWVIN
jgi:hypothetical protein